MLNLQYLKNYRSPQKPIAVQEKREFKPKLFIIKLILKPGLKIASENSSNRLR